MKKLSLQDALKSTTMFLIDGNIENMLENEICTTINKYQKKMLGISNFECLRDFIKSNRDSIEMLETLLGISGEKMKRVVSMIRLTKGYTFETEWDEYHIQKELATNNELMNEFCDLFLKGKDLPKYQKLIPYFILQDFKIDADTIGRLSNEDFLRSLIKSHMIASYSAKYSHVYERLLSNAIKPIALKEGLIFISTSFEKISPAPCFVITDNKKKIIINYSFLSTTSNSQNKYADNHVSRIYSEQRENNSILVLNMLDGAGWIGRFHAYKKIYTDCHYFANLQNIDIINQIVIKYFNNIPL